MTVGFRDNYMMNTSTYNVAATQVPRVQQDASGVCFGYEVTPCLRYQGFVVILTQFGRAAGARSGI